MNGGAAYVLAVNENGDTMPGRILKATLSTLKAEMSLSGPSRSLGKPLRAGGLSIEEDRGASS